MVGRAVDASKYDRAVTVFPVIAGRRHYHDSIQHTVFNRDAERIRLIGLKHRMSK